MQRVGAEVTDGEAGLMAAFNDLPDPRTRACPYPLDELLLVALCAITSGAEHWVEVVHWAHHRLDWLKQFLPFKHGIASHDTFTRVFSLLDAKAFESCFIGWMKRLCPELAQQAIAIDGKSVRRSYRADGRMVHLVSTWYSAAGVVLGQVKTADKSNEITAIPQLLDALDIQGATITLDAMGCQHSIAQKIVDRGADYVLAVKDNQPTLSQALQEWFAGLDGGRLLDQSMQTHTATDSSHGRVQTRRCVVSADVDWLKDIGQDWVGVKSVVMVHTTRAPASGKSKPEELKRYYISTLSVQAVAFNNVIRGHWGIENELHWVLDVAFREDDCRIRTGDGAQNFAILRRIALNQLKQERASKVGVHAKRLKAGWSTDYLQTLLGLTPKKRP